MKHAYTLMVRIAVLVLVCAVGASAATKRNIVFILVDDMRFDSMGCAGHSFLKTPALDRLAADGIRFTRAFVTTSLCSPSRASFLTGLYAHKHNVLNNASRLPAESVTFPRRLQENGYRTAFVGKWHMGSDSDDPRPGFDHWASFRGQGSYTKNDFNINGEKKVVAGYVTDVITRMATDWLDQQEDGPFMLYVSHKAVHAGFIPAPRHRDAFSDLKIPAPDSMAHTPENYFRKPKWVLAQRNSWHGVDDMYFKRTSFEPFIRDYHRTMLAVDDGVGAIVAKLKEKGLYASTLLVFTSDNGFLHGEHGLIDKRCMYEPSIRIPMIMTCPELFEAGREMEQMVLNVDVAPTFLEAAGLPAPESMQGRSFFRLPTDPAAVAGWREAILYEYFFERSFPETPTCIGIRTDRYKFIEYHGIWDANELYDLEADPDEMHNLISTSHRKRPTVDSPHRQAYRELRNELDRLRDELGVRRLPTWAR